MINQELNIAILELFDEIKEMDLFKVYKINEEKALNNPEVNRLINKINTLSDLTYSVSYQPSLDEITTKISKLTSDLENNEFYNSYMCSYQECNDYLKHLSELIFKDIVEVESECFCEHKSR